MSAAVENRATWYFVDESGDPVFFSGRGQAIVGQPGCSPILLVGFVQMTAPRATRLALAELRQGLLADPYLRSIPSMVKTARAFHAKDDCPEVRKAVFELLVGQEFTYQCVVARKQACLHFDPILCESNRLYDYLVSILFGPVLHQSLSSKVYFAKRGERSRQRALDAAIRRGVHGFQAAEELERLTRERGGPPVSDTSWNVQVQCQTPSDEPCLQVVDYMNWAVQRAFLRGEMRYFDFVRDRVELVFDLHDDNRRPVGNRYDRTVNPFDAKKISPL